VTKLPAGPTAFFKLSNFKFSKEIEGHGRPTSHNPGASVAACFLPVLPVSATARVVCGATCVRYFCTEIILNRFDTRLGRRMGRIFGSMFPQKPDLVGRQAVTFHNQRDFIFVRRHRFICESDKVRMLDAGVSQIAMMLLETLRIVSHSGVVAVCFAVYAIEPPQKVRLQELGPRFTLKLRWLLADTFNTSEGEYEWFHKRHEMDKTRRKFHL
jgi:ribosome production factor 1